MKGINNYTQRLYAGWLGKLIGIRYGAPIEGYTYEKIKRNFGNLNGYIIDYKDFSADDDSNGPIFFIRALNDYNKFKDITPKDIGLSWLNYAPYEHGFYWWGGYGISTEHTAYLNMRNGIMPPMSGSIKQNGPEVAEQIGGQIFIDTWGLVAPGDPELAAELARKAASVSHDGNGIYGGIFVAVCISLAFTETDIKTIVNKSLEFIPADSTYYLMAKDVIKHYEKSNNWEETLFYIKENYGYDKYLGNCHIIPNAAVIVLSLLDSKGDFSRGINTCNMCGWDTDCNVANVGTILGVLGGLEALDYDKWVKPINDLLICSSVIGSLNIMDIPENISYLASVAYKLMDQEPPSEWKDFVSGNLAKFNFELPSSTHGFRVDYSGEYYLRNTREHAFTGQGSLMLYAKTDWNEEEIKVYHKTYYTAADLHDNRYEPSFSPIIYPGQQISCYLTKSVETEGVIKATIFARDSNNNQIIKGDSLTLTDKWQRLELTIPNLGGSLIKEVGIIMTTSNNNDISVFMADFDFSGEVNYDIDFTKESIDLYHVHHKEVTQFTRLKGLWGLEQGELSGSCSDFGEAYTGLYNLKDYAFTGTMIPKTGNYHQLLFRVKGAIHSYSLSLKEGILALEKNNNGYFELIHIKFDWDYKKSYTFKVEVQGNKISIFNSTNELLIEYVDHENPYLEGQIGAGIREGSHCHFENFSIKENS